jgi:hypothetical protein
MRHRAIHALATAGTVVVASVAIGGGHASFADTQANSGAVRTWNQIAIEALMNPTNAGVQGAGLPPNVGGLHLGIVQGAVYDAVNSIDSGHQPLVPGVPVASPDASLDAAVITAAHLVLDQLVHEIVPAPISLGAVNDRIDDLRDDAMSSIPDGPAKDAGEAAGEAAAAAMMGTREGDGRFDDESFPVGTDPGEWPANPNDATAWVATARPIVIQNAADFRTAGPRNLNSDAYAQEYDEVKTLGAVGSARTPEQQALADFFNVNPVVLYNRTFRAVSVAQGLSLAEDARLFAMINISAADGFVACWADKGRWAFWRPITAIRAGDSDGNKHTVGVDDWTPYAATPAYPDHPSGYNCATGSVMTAAKAFFGTDHMEFDVVRIAPGVPNVTRHYERFSEVTEDTIDARIYQGLHFRSADVQAVRLGKHVAEWIDAHAFRPVDRP